MLEHIPMLTDTGTAQKTRAVLGSVDDSGGEDDAEVVPDALCDTEYRIAGQINVGVVLAHQFETIDTPAPRLKFDYVPRYSVRKITLNYLHTVRRGALGR